MRVSARVKALSFRLLRAVLVMYGTLFLIQRLLVFPFWLPGMFGPLKTPAEYGLAGFSETSLTAEDGVKLIAWEHRPAPGRPYMLYLHGNAMNLSARIPLYKALAAEGYGVLALSWRGYGRSEGWPSEEGLYRDARAAMKWLKEQDADIIILGESLGSGPAVQMATEFPVAGLVLQSGYSSIADVAAETYWFLPGTHALIWDRFDSLAKLPRVTAPVLLLHGRQDSEIPYAHSERLAAAAAGPVKLVLLPEAGHVDIKPGIVLKEMKGFFTEAQHGSGKP